MTVLADIIEINTTQTDAAIDLNRSLDNQNLIRCFAPTKAAINVFEHICKAALPQATQEQRAINLFGNYGSGKSHTAVILAQLLRDGCEGVAFSGLFQRLNNFGEVELAKRLSNTFLKASDPDAKPYLLVSLYGSDAPTLSAQLMEGLYDALERHPSLNHQAILPTTEYEVAVKRFDEMVNNNPALNNAALPRHLAKDYSDTKEMRVYLEQHRPEALTVFKAWHKEVCHGALFNPANDGGKGFIDAYKEAGKNLYEQHNFSGIVIVWDEFGFALEDLLNNTQRNASFEIMELQRFVETVCAPSLGHTLFIGLSHVSFPEYAERLNVSAGIKDSLERISGRFNRAFKIELSVTESEGYHLLEMQRSWTAYGKDLLLKSEHNKQTLFNHCRTLPLFNKLGHQLNDVLNEVYPLHPITAAGLFALSDYSQSNRTAVMFFRDNVPKLLYRDINGTGLFSNELIRLPELVDYYSDKIKEKASKEFERYQKSINKIPAGLPKEQITAKQAILKLCLLAELLGENFQTTENFLTIALYDKNHHDALMQDLLWLRELEVVWKNELTGQWTLSGDTGVDIEAKITEQLPNFEKRSTEELFKHYPDLLTDLLPQIGVHDLEPSNCGIIRSYQVELLSASFNPPKLNNPLISGKLYLVFTNTPEEAEQAKQTIENTPETTQYFWLPLTGIKIEFCTIEGKRLNLNGLLCRYLALEVLLKQKTNSEELHRQLTTKWEKTRQEALNILRMLFGRDGLQTGKSQIFKAGAGEALNCHSWHDIRNQLAEDIKHLYSSETPIRANNMNKLNSDKYTGSSTVLKIVERILDFDKNSKYQNDLLGENGTSELSALIDGILGANQLFIQRPSGWDIKKVNETQGNIHTVLKYIHDTLLRKRETPYLIKKLRDELIAPPYGIPACNLAIFAAVAIRYEVKRLRWGSTKEEKDFAKNLTNAFNEDSKTTIRLFEFSSKQFAMLFAVGKYFQITQKPEQIPEEFAIDCSYKLRDFIKQQSDTIKNSPKLQDKTRELVKFFSSSFYTPQDSAEFLIKLVNMERESEGNIASKSVVLLKELLDDFLKLEDAKRHELITSWQRFIDTDITDLISRLSNERSSAMAKAIAGLIKQGHNIDVNLLTQALLYKTFDKCTDSDIGQCKGELNGLKNYHPPILDPTPPPIITPSPSVVNEPKIYSYDNLISQLRSSINATQLPRNTIKQVLEQLLNDYKDE
jgi:hypothetical protein